MNKKPPKKGSSNIKPDKKRREKGRRTVKPGAFVVLRSHIFGACSNLAWYIRRKLST